MCAKAHDATSRRRFVRRYRSRTEACRQSAWEPFARLVLEATYEATLLAAVEQSLAGRSNTVLLTRVGGGVFGNADAWIDDAIVRAPTLVEHAGLDIQLVSYGQVHQLFRAITERFGG